MKKILKLKDILNAYNLLVKGIDEQANNQLNDDEARAYGGIVRAGKGLLVEGIAKNLVEIAWNELGGDSKRLSTEKRVINIPIKKDYIGKIKNPDVKKFIEKNIDKYFYKLRSDVQVYIDNKLALVIECKAYTENAMLKRVLVDFTFLKQVFPNADAILFQLESQLGGDYSDIKKQVKFGSYPTHTILSYFDVNLNIITLLEGERKINKPIHKKKYFKELKIDSLKKALETIKKLLSDNL